MGKGLKLSTFKRRSLMLLLLALVLLTPTILGGFLLTVATEMVIMSLFALSFNLLFGYMGRLSFGQAAYLGIAGYALTLMSIHTHMNFFVCSIVGLLAGGLYALATSYFATRLSGTYLSIMTVVIAEGTFYLTFEWYGFTNGPNGLAISPPTFLLDPMNYYLYALAVAIPAIVLFWRLVNSSFGAALICIRENSDRTPFIGISLRKHMMVAFIIAGLYASLAGVLWAPFNRGISPWFCGMTKSGDAVFMAILGGAYTFAGPILGAVLWTLLDTFVSRITEYWPLTIGVIIILVIMFMKGGILGTLYEKVGRRSKVNRHGITK
jgi:branched-chain amino acid transport system permease protein